MKWQNYITVDEWVELYKHIARIKELALLRAASGGGGADPVGSRAAAKPKGYNDELTDRNQPTRAHDPSQKPL